MQLQEPLIAWSFHEYEKHNRTIWWYVIFAIFIGLLLVYSIITSDYLFGVIAVLIAIVFFLRHWYDPRELTIEIHTEGIRIGTQFHHFHTISQFSIVESDSNEYLLYIQRKVGFRNLMSIPIKGREHSEVRLTLSQYLPEDTAHFRETIWDGLERFLKL